MRTHQHTGAVEKLLDQILDLPDWAQVEILRALTNSRAADGDLDRGDEDHRASVLGQS
jgi:hypothetical protein